MDEAKWMDSGHYPWDKQMFKDKVSVSSFLSLWLTKVKHLHLVCLPLQDPNALANWLIYTWWLWVFWHFRMCEALFTTFPIAWERCYCGAKLQTGSHEEILRKEACYSRKYFDTGCTEWQEMRNLFRANVKMRNIRAMASCHRFGATGRSAMYLQWAKNAH